MNTKRNVFSSWHILGLSSPLAVLSQKLFFVWEVVICKSMGILPESKQQKEPTVPTDFFGSTKEANSSGASWPQWLQVRAGMLPLPVKEERLPSENVHESVEGLPRTRALSSLLYTYFVAVRNHKIISILSFPGRWEMWL